MLCGELESLADEEEGEVPERGVLEDVEDDDVEEDEEWGVIELFAFGCVGEVGELGELGEVADCGLLLLGMLVVFGVLRVPGAVATRDRRCEPLEFGFSAEFDGED